jgi:hypothetical protein
VRPTFPYGLDGAATLFTLGIGQETLSRLEGRTVSVTRIKDIVEEYNFVATQPIFLWNWDIYVSCF